MANNESSGDFCVCDRGGDEYGHVTRLWLHLLVELRVAHSPKNIQKYVWVRTDVYTVTI